MRSITKSTRRLRETARAAGLTLATVFYILSANPAQVAAQTVRTLTFPMAGTSVAPRVTGPIIAEAYSRLGYSVELIDVPQLRSLAMANDDQLDGELARTAAIAETYTNLIRIDPPIYHISPHFFSRRADIAIGDWKRGSFHSIGIVRGALAAAELTDGVDTVVVDDPVSLFRMLGAGRLDLGIAPKDSGPLYAIMAGVANVQAVGTPLSTTDLFHYVSAKNAAIAPDISRILRLMTDNGELEGLRRRGLEQLYDEAQRKTPDQTGSANPCCAHRAEG